MELAASAPDWAGDLLVVARAVSLADRRAHRDKQAWDTWTREIELRVQVHDADRWTPALPELDRLLAILTSDVWRVRVRPGAAPVDPAHRLFGGAPPPDTVALFSGGLDSTAYAAQCQLVGLAASG